MKKNNKRYRGRVKEEPTKEYRGQANKKTSNVQRKETTRPTDQQYDLEERLLDYAVRIIRLVDALPRTPAGRHAGDQLLRCGTSPLANHGEGQAAESRKDFIHKFTVCLKELRECWRWLRVVHRLPLIKAAKVEPLLSETEELIKIFSASIKTAKKNKG